MGNSIVVVIIAVVAVAVVAGIVWFILHRRYVKAIEGKGWTWHGDTSAEVTIGLNHAPFGVGFKRRASHLIEGRSQDGTPFRAFDYDTDQASSRELTVVMPLPRPVPTLWVFPQGQQRPWVQGQLVGQGPFTAVSEDADFGHRAVQAMAHVLQPPSLGKDGRPAPLDLSLDHSSIVLHDVTRDVEGLATSVEWLSHLRQALLDASLPHAGEPAPDHLSFQGRSHWVYYPRNDAYLDHVSHDREGFDHEAHDVIVSDNHGLPFVRLHHTWKTRETRGSGNNRRTVTVHHDEYLCEFSTTFPFREVSVNWGIFSGEVARFESTAFNDAYKVRSPSARFASDVFHPRLMEFMLHNRIPDFKVYGNGQIQVRASRQWLPDDIDMTSDFLQRFFSFVPNFVWQELGLREPPQIGR